MHKAGLLAAIAVSCIAAAAHGRPMHLPAPSFAPPHPAVVRVAAPERNGMAFGSGALVDVNEYFGLVVTNWHVVRDATGTIGVFFPDGFRSAAVVLRVDRDWDLAALAVWRPNARPVAVSTQSPRPGEMLTIAGYGSGSYRAVSGVCTQYVSPGGNQPFEMIELAAPARDGDSGGPIFNARGELAGVLFGSAFGKTSGSHCGRVREFLSPVAGDFRRLNSEQLLARRRAVEPAPVAAITGPQPPAPALEQKPAPAPLPVAPAESLPASMESHKPSPEPASAAVAAPAAPVQPPTPDSTNENIKSVLAAIGLAAVVYCALRMLGWAVG